MTIQIVPTALAIVVLAAAFTDVKSRTIPNWLTLASIPLGLALHTWMRGLEGLKFSGLGLLLACAIFIPLFALRWLGGGDVKLYMGIGALAGMSGLLLIVFLDAVLGAVIALVLIVVKGRLRRTFANIGRMFGALGRGRAPYQESRELEAGSEESFGMPRAVTIAAATLIVVAVTVVQAK